MVLPYIPHYTPYSVQHWCHQCIYALYVYRTLTHVSSIDTASDVTEQVTNWIIISCFMLNRGITINDQQLRGVNFDVELYTLYTCIKLIDPTVKLCKSENGYSVIVGVYS